MTRWSEGLTKAQMAAASHAGTHARILAGPGTGKTHTMARRVVWLTTHADVSPDNIVILTFTRAASSELRGKIKSELEGYNCDTPRVSTLHSFALRQVLRNQELVSLPSPLRIADDYEERYVIVEDLKKVLNQRVSNVEDLLNKLSSDWQELKADLSDWEDRFPNPRFLGAWKQHRAVYGYTLRAELVYRLKQLLVEQGSEVDLEGPPHYVLVDEYQDLNACDLAIIKALSDRGSEVYCAGDDDQSIYGFRYANPEGIRRFPKEFPKSENFVLDVCHRCGRKILEFGNYVADQDPQRISKSVRCTSDSASDEARILRFQTGRKEAEGIAQIAVTLISRLKVSPGEILILLRTDTNRRYSKPIKEVLEKFGIAATTTSNPLDILNETDGRKMLSRMTLIAHPRDHLAWRALLQLSDGIGQTTLDNVYKIAVENAWSYYHTLLEIKKNPGILPRGGEKVKAIVDRIAEDVRDLGTPDTGLLEWIEDVARDTINNDDTRKEILELFTRIVSNSESTTLVELLRSMSTALEDKEQERDPDKISIMTMHQAKGLSSDAVILAGAEDEILPGRNNDNEDRRLLYVSLTRARHYLFITYCQKRVGNQKYSGRNPGATRRNLSRFLSGGPIRPEDGAEFCRRFK